MYTLSQQIRTIVFLVQAYFSKPPADDDAEPADPEIQQPTSEVKLCMMPSIVRMFEGRTSIAPTLYARKSQYQMCARAATSECESGGHLVIAPILRIQAKLRYPHLGEALSIPPITDCK
jgi:hypothetical protein